MQLGGGFHRAWYWLISKIIDRMPSRQKSSLSARLIMRIYAKNARVAHRIGWTYCMARDYKQAEHYLRKSIVLDQRNAGAHHTLGIALSSQDKWIEALPSFQSATTLQPNSSDFWVGLGQCQKEIGEFPAARASLNEALRLNPENADAFIQLSVVHSELKDWEAALQCSRAYIRLRPAEELGYWGESAALAELGRFGEAIASSQRTLEINPRSLPAIKGLAWTYQKLGRYPNAILELKRALAIMPDSAEVRGWLAWTYVQVNDLDAASEQQKIIAQLDPSLANELATLIAESRESPNNC